MQSNLGTRTHSTICKHYNALQPLAQVLSTPRSPKHAFEQQSDPLQASPWTRLSSVILQSLKIRITFRTQVPTALSEQPNTSEDSIGP